MSFKSTLLRFALLSSFIAFGCAAHAQIVVQSLRGDVRAGGAALTQNQQVPVGATVTTGQNAQAVLRFEDGQHVVLHQNTEFQITDYRFEAAQPANDRTVFALLKGAARFVSGRLAQRSRTAFALRTPNATIGIRGTDFTIARQNPDFGTVANGSISATNAGGTAAFNAGTTFTIGSQNLLATVIQFGQLPPGIGQTINSLGSVQISAAATGVQQAGPAGSGAPGAAAGGGLGAAGVAAGVAIGAGVLGGLSSSDSQDNATTTTTTR
jgi:hypothetical protein